MMPDVNKLKIKYITNCAVFLECGTVKILADGIFSGKQPFNIMDEKTEEAIINGSGLFQNLDYLLVTHCHNDHYNGSKILRFLANHPGTKLIVPANAKLDPERLEAARAEVIFLDEPEGLLRRLDFGTFQIEYMKVRHLTYHYPDHYCYNILIGRTNVLLTADMDIDRISYLERFTRNAVSTAFFSHIFLWHRKWRAKLADLKYSELYFYHLPDEDRDICGYRQRTIVYWEKYGKDLPRAKLLGYETGGAT